MHIQDFFQNFLKFFLVGLHGDCTISLIAQDIFPGMHTLAVGQTKLAIPPPGTYPVQSRLLCNHRAIQLKKFQKILKKILNVHLNLLHLYIKFQDQIRPPLEITKKTNFLTKVIVQMEPKFVFFVTSRGGRIWPWNFIYIWSKLRCTFKIFFQNFLKLF